MRISAKDCWPRFYVIAILAVKSCEHICNPACASVPGCFLLSERAGDRVLSLPNFPEMTEEQLDYVAAQVKEAVM